jgi:hypothetical protein
VVDIDLQSAKLFDDVFETFGRQLADVDVDAFLAQSPFTRTRARRNGLVSFTPARSN